MRAGWKSPARVVVKVGSAVIAPAGTLDVSAVERLAGDVSDVLRDHPRTRVVLVSSGAVASGFQSLGLSRPPREIVGKQAAAAVGQPMLMRSYAQAFAATRPARSVAQVLLTADDLDHRARFLNVRNTLDTLLRAGVIPVINENDSVSFEEIKLGDNDHLSAMIAGIVDAELLVILSSVRGVWDSDQETSRRAGGGGNRAERKIVPEIRSLAEGLRHVRSDITQTGVGGMATKIRAACTAAALGASVVIADGTHAGIVSRLVRGEPIGTHFPASRGSRSDAARKRWIGLSARPRGTLIVDDGARRAIEQRGASLLPGGVRQVKGSFEIGALVELQDPNGESFARGIASYESEEIGAIAGKRSGEIASVLGYCYRDEVVHRDQLVLLESRGLGAPSVVRADAGRGKRGRS